MDRLKKMFGVGGQSGGGDEELLDPSSGRALRPNMMPTLLSTGAKGPARALPSTVGDSGGGSYSSRSLVNVRDLMHASSSLATKSSGGGDGGPSSRTEFLNNSVRVMINLIPSAMIPRTRAEREEQKRSHRYETIQEYLVASDKAIAEMNRVFEEQQASVVKYYKYLWKSKQIRHPPEAIRNREFRRRFQSMARIFDQVETRKEEEESVRQSLRELKINMSMDQLDSKLAPLIETLLDIREELVGSTNIQEQEKRFETIKDRSDRLDQMSRHKSTQARQIINTMGKSSRAGGRSREYGDDEDDDEDDEETARMERMFMKMMPYIDPDYAKLADQERARREASSDGLAMPVASATAVSPTTVAVAESAPPVEDRVPSTSLVPVSAPPPSNGKGPMYALGTDSDSDGEQEDISSSPHYLRFIEETRMSAVSRTPPPPPIKETDMF